MKKFTSILSSYLGHVGFYFLLVMLIFAFVALATFSATVNLVLIWSALLFSALLALWDFAFKLKFLGAYAVKLILHTILTVLSFALSFVWVSGVIESGKSAVWSILIFSIFMIFIAGIRSVFHVMASKKENESKTYDYLYTPKD